MLLRFQNDSDETAFRRAQIAASHSGIRTLVACNFIAVLTYAIYYIIVSAPPVGAPGVIALAVMPPIIKYVSTECHTPTLRLVALWMFASMVNLRLSWGVLMFSADAAPPTVQSGYVLPYAMSGTLACMTMGSMLGLRFMRDILPPVLITLVTSVAHTVVVLFPGGGTLHYPIATVAVTLLGCAAEYHNESLERHRWKSLSEIKRCEGAVSTSEIAHLWQHKSSITDSPFKTDAVVSVVEDSKLTASSWCLVGSFVVCMVALVYGAFDTSDVEGPASVRNNHPVPYAVLGVPILVYSGQLMNLRPSKDCTTHCSCIPLVSPRSSSLVSHCSRIPLVFSRSFPLAPRPPLLTVSA